MIGNRRGLLAGALATGIALLTALATPASAHSGSAKSAYFRQVLCEVPAFTPPAHAVRLTPSSCDAASAFASHTASPSDSATGYTVDDVPADTTLANVPSTPASKDTPHATVLLPGLAGAGATPGTRFLLGPAQMTSSAVADARASRAQYPGGRWVVDFRMTSQGAALWDRATHADFHRLLAVDVDGIVVSAPIIEPTQSSFSSFGGRGEISQNFTRAEAQKIARAL